MMREEVGDLFIRNIWQRFSPNVKRIKQLSNLPGFISLFRVSINLRLLIRVDKAYRFLERFFGVMSEIGVFESKFQRFPSDMNEVSRADPVI